MMTVFRCHGDSSPPTTLPGTSSKLRRQLIREVDLGVAGEVVLVAVMRAGRVAVQSGSVAGAHVLVSVTGACLRTKVIGNVQLAVAADLIQVDRSPKRLSPSGTLRASIVMIEGLAIPARRHADARLGTGHVEVGRADHRELPGATVHPTGRCAPCAAR